MTITGNSAMLSLDLPLREVRGSKGWESERKVCRGHFSTRGVLRLPEHRAKAARTYVGNRVMRRTDELLLGALQNSGLVLQVSHL